MVADGGINEWSWQSAFIVIVDEWAADQKTQTWA